MVPAIWKVVVCSWTLSSLPVLGWVVCMMVVCTDVAGRWRRGQGGWDNTLLAYLPAFVVLSLIINDILGT